MTSRELYETHVKHRKEGCWGWDGPTTTKGYAVLRHNRARKTAHRWSYEHFVGAIPKDSLVLHSCDERTCTNPHHLWVGTPKDNSLDMVRKGRSAHQFSHSQSRKDISIADVLQLKQQGIPRREIEKRLGCSNRVLLNRIKWSAWQR